MGYGGPVLLRVSDLGFRVEYGVHCKSQWMVVKSQTGPQEAFRSGTTLCPELYSIFIYIYIYVYICI